MSRVADSSGKAYWRSLDDQADAPAFRDLVERKFPASMRELIDGDGGIDRRKFLHLMAASIGLAGLAGCRRPDIKILPYARPPEDVVAGLPTYYATAMPRPGSAFPVLVETHEGRPTKIEGNPRHPESLGATDTFAQASILDLYDPDRSSEVLHEGRPSSWQAFDDFAAGHFAGLRDAKGEGLRFLTEDLASPAMELLRAHVAATLPEARWHAYEPLAPLEARRGAELAFGAAVEPRYRLDRAEVILTLDCDLFGEEEAGVSHLRGFAGSRSPGDARPMNRLYVVESKFTTTGGMADHRLRLAASHVRDYAVALARAILPGEGELRKALDGYRPGVVIEGPWIEEVAADLRAREGKGLVAVGRRQPAFVHALAHAINAELGNNGETVRFLPAPKGGAGTIEELAGAIADGRVNTLVVLGGNPAYNAPADLDFAGLLANGRVPTTIRHGLHADETAEHASWHLPALHFLESWDLVRAGDGSLAAVQPMIEPLFGGRSAAEVVARLSKFDTHSAYEIARRAFRPAAGEGDFEASWRAFLHDGFREGTAANPVTPAIDPARIARAVAGAKALAPLGKDRLELVFHACPKVDDGRYANNGWLQEAPDPITKLTWDNTALLSRKTAEALGVATGDVVSLAVGGKSVECVASILPGQADWSVSVALGYGRRQAGRVGRGVGFDLYPMRTSARPGIVDGVQVRKTGRTYPLACTQEHSSMEGRDLIREQDVHVVQIGHAERKESFEDIQRRPAFDEPHQWGMAIDLNTCVGCNACVVACQAENNIPIVGKDEVARGREMHWIRNDRYFTGDDPDDPGLATQPVACVHCENAPCEAVCPVNAAVHNSEGLNLQVYNRCVGTRYCSNNCPYKVRRFNFFNYNERPLDALRLGPLAEKGMAETLKMQKNPDVTVRIRGVMEKCTYCLQRIERAKIGVRVAAGDSGASLEVPDGTITPACAQACPARAIVFGNVADPESRVSKLKAQERDYALLGELNTKPRTTYQARLKNPNPKMPAHGRAEGHA